ncbi:MAG: hypothetical protein AB8F26_03635 [Phycisphaerales bacterium]
MPKDLKIKDVSAKSRKQDQTLARPLAPEDIRAGIYVMVLKQKHEFARWSNEFGGGIAVSRLDTSPSDGQQPSQVISTCLPFVVVETSKGNPYCFDIRTVQLARVGASFARDFSAIGAKRDSSKKVSSKRRESKKEKHNKRKKSDRRKKRRKR